MPTRDRRGPLYAKWYCSAAAEPPLNSLALSSAFGTVQSISSLNNTGVFIPGVYKAAPVLISRATTLRADPIHVLTQYKYGNYMYKICFEKDWPAFLAKMNSGIPLLIAQPWNSSLADGSISRAYAKLAEPEYDLGVNLGELRETIEGLMDPLSAFRKWLKQVEKLHQTTVKVWQRNKFALIDKKWNHYTLSMLGSSWLEWRMAVRPLIQAVEELIEHLGETDIGLDDRLRRVKASLKRETKDLRAVTGNSANVACEGVQQTVVKTRASTAIYYKQQIRDEFGARYGIDYASAPAVMWELARLSFVVDRFIRIGDFLQSFRGRLTATREIIGVVTSLKHEITIETTLLNIRPITTFVHWSNVKGTYSCRREILDRRLNLALPVLPSVNWNGLNLQQYMDHAALLWQALPKPNWRDLQKTAFRADYELGKLHFADKRKFKIK